MMVETHTYYSNHLNRDMTFKMYGHSGKPVIVFPSSGGSYYEYEDFGMIDACQWFIDEGYIRFFTPESMDNESWLSQGKSHYEIGDMHNRYDLYIIDELIPFIKHYTGHFDPMIVTGCSMGGFHAVNFGLRHPDVFDTVIALSGVYDARFFLGDYNDMKIYENSPIDYLWNMDDPWFIDKYRSNTIIVVTGQGSWEEVSIRDTRKLEEAFQAKLIPAWCDYWGFDVNHDWPWWRRQMPYYLGKLIEMGKLQK